MVATPKPTADELEAEPARELAEELRSQRSALSPEGGEARLEAAGDEAPLADELDGELMDEEEDETGEPAAVSYLTHADSSSCPLSATTRKCS